MATRLSLNMMILNTFIAKCTLHQAIILTLIQIPILLIRVPSTKDQIKLLFRIATLSKIGRLIPLHISCANNT